MILISLEKYTKWKRKAFELEIQMKQYKPLHKIKGGEKVMKILIAALFSTIVLSACARYPAQIPLRPPVVEVTNVDDKNATPPPPGFNNFCNKNDGVLVVYVKKNGDVNSRECPGITRQKNRPTGVDEPVGIPTYLGAMQKYRKPGDPDPCVEWTNSGYLYNYCWDL
jgi:hypothetical protein